jgi:osmotically-inducible protein OsmY
MKNNDAKLARQVAAVVAVVVEDLDAVSVEVEDGVVYIEGVVPEEEQRRSISGAVRGIEGVDQLISCLAVEHVLPRRPSGLSPFDVPAPVQMHYRSLS